MTRTRTWLDLRPVTSLELIALELLADFEERSVLFELEELIKCLTLNIEIAIFKRK